MSKKASNLKSLFAKHIGKVSDKWSIYIAEYDRLFLAYRKRRIVLLEIGIQNGGSLEIWSNYFSNAEKLVGCDINPECAKLQFDDPKIVVVAANANTDEAEQLILAHSPDFDLILDDGSHLSGDIICSFARYFAHLKDGGLYVVEDIHCSYWQDFEGGLFHPHSPIAFFKLLADIINYEHWGIDKTRCELLDGFNRKYNKMLDEITFTHIHSIEFINSMCVIKKAKPADNILGCRVIAGTIAAVDEAPLTLNRTSSPHLDQSTNQWSARGLPMEEKLMKLIEEVASLKQTVSERNGEIASIKKVVAESTQLYLVQLTQLWQQIETQLLELSEQGKKFSTELQKIQQTNVLQKDKQPPQYSESEEELNPQPPTKQD